MHKQLDQNPEFEKTEITDIASWLTALDEIDSYLRFNRKIDTFKLVWPEKSRTKPFMNVTGAHHLYAMCGGLALKDTTEEFVTLAAAVVLVGRDLLFGHPGRNYRSSTDNAFDGLRLSQGLPISKIYPHEIHSIEDALQKFKDLMECAPAKSNEFGYLQNFERVLRFFVKDVGGVRKGGKIVRNDKILVSGRRDAKIQVQSVFRLPERDRVRIRRDGLAENEFIEDVEYFSSTILDQEDLKEAPTLAEQVIRRKAALDQIARGGQQLPLSWGRLSDAELALFLHALKEKTIEALRLTDYSRLHLEKCVATAVLFWGGRTPEELVRLRLYANRDCLPEHFPRTGCAYLFAEQHLVLPVARPKGSPRYRGADFTQAHPCTDRVMLPLGPFLHPWISKLPTSSRLKHSQNPAGLDGVEAFVCDAQELITQVKDLIQEIADQTGARLSVARLSKTLHHRVLLSTGDHAVASIGLGVHRKLADTALHYLSIPENVAVDHVVSTNRSIAKNVVTELAASGIKVKSPPKVTSSSAPQTYLGSPIDPLPETVHSIATQLENAVKAVRRDVVSESYRLRFHNAFASYIHMMLRYGTGLREVGDPIPDWRRINLDRGVIILSDKDDVASFSSRILPMPELMIEQLRQWQRHVANNIDYFNVLGGMKNNSSWPVISYLGYKRGRVELVQSTDAQIRDQVMEFIPEFNLPWNCNRHYLRSRLTELGCQGELIDFVMGHWTRGTEPWGRFSALPANHAHEKLRPFLDKVLQATGFRLVRIEEL